MKKRKKESRPSKKKGQRGTSTPPPEWPEVPLQSEAQRRANRKKVGSPRHDVVISTPGLPGDTIYADRRRNMAELQEERESLRVGSPTTKKKPASTLGGTRSRPTLRDAAEKPRKERCKPHRRAAVVTVFVDDEERGTIAVRKCRRCLKEGR